MLAARFILHHETLMKLVELFLLSGQSEAGLPLRSAGQWNPPLVQFLRPHRTVQRCDTRTLNISLF